MNRKSAKRVRKSLQRGDEGLDKSVYLTTTQFAKRAGVSSVAVRQAIESGRITAIMAGQWYRINVNTELERYVATLSRTHIHTRRKAEQTQANRTPPASPSGDDDDGITSLNAPLMERVFKAKRAQLEYQQAKKELLPAETVAAEWQNIAQGILSALLTIPDRVAPMMEGMAHREIHNTLVKEIKHACQQLSDSIRPEEG